MAYVRNGVIAFLLFSSNSVLADNCLNYLSAGAEAIGEFAICRVTHKGKPGTYACQRYQDSSRMFVILFNGGTSPQVIYSTDLDLQQPIRVEWDRATANTRLSCQLARPDSIPASARYLGTGVCENDANRKVPCSLYHHAAARSKTMEHYMVFFDVHGRGASSVEIFPSGENNQAMIAELAYQLGMAKMKTACCRRQAAAYLRFAYEAFPRSKVYRDAYFALSLSIQATANVNRESFSP